MVNQRYVDKSQWDSLYSGEIEYKPDYPNADEIIPGIWLGDRKASEDINFIDRFDIKVIINCTKSLPSVFSKVKYYRIPVEDNLQKSEINKMYKYLIKIMPILESHYKNQETILIHCYAGIQRSAILTAAFLYRITRCPIRDIIMTMKYRRRIVFTPGMNFADTLRRFMEIGRNPILRDIVKEQVQSIPQPKHAPHIKPVSQMKPTTNGGTIRLRNEHQIINHKRKIHTNTISIKQSNNTFQK